MDEIIRKCFQFDSISPSPDYWEKGFFVLSTCPKVFHYLRGAALAAWRARRGAKHGAKRTPEGSGGFSRNALIIDFLLPFGQILNNFLLDI